MTETQPPLDQLWSKVVWRLMPAPNPVVFRDKLLARQGVMERLELAKSLRLDVTPAVLRDMRDAGWIVILDLVPLAEQPDTDHRILHADGEFYYIPTPTEQFICLSDAGRKHCGVATGDPTLSYPVNTEIIIKGGGG